MKYQEGYKSKNVIDRRASSRRAGGGAAVAGAGGLGVVGVVVALLMSVLGGGDIDLGTVLAGLDTGGTRSAQQVPAPVDGPDPESDQVEFISFVLDSNQEFWDGLFADAGRDYQAAQLILYRDQTNSGCGAASSAVGPFYCPADQTVHVDLGFFEELRRRFGAPGDFAQAYVIAHEIGHHVQNELGISAQMRQLQAQNPGEKNELSVALELQADCFAGVWANAVFEQGLLERGDIEEGLGAAEAVGDDTIQASAGMSVNPESWTHGSSDQRRAWFTEGYETGDPSRCDTFA